MIERLRLYVCLLTLLWVSHVCQAQNTRFSMDGEQYRFSFATGDAGDHTREEFTDPFGAVIGKFSYVDPNGNRRVMRYRADELGFHPIGYEVFPPPPAPVEPEVTEPPPVATTQQQIVSQEQNVTETAAPGTTTEAVTAAAELETEGPTEAAPVAIPEVLPEVPAPPAPPAVPVAPAAPAPVIVEEQPTVETHHVEAHHEDVNDIKKKVFPAAVTFYNPFRVLTNNHFPILDPAQIRFYRT